jgi:hypothetical protein
LILQSITVEARQAAHLPSIPRIACNARMARG